MVRNYDKIVLYFYNRIRERSKDTKQKRKSQICRVYRVKIGFSHLNEAQRLHLKMVFVEAKWLHIYALTFMKDRFLPRILRECDTT